MPEGAVLEDDKEEWSPDGELVITGIVDGKPEYSRIEVNNVAHLFDPCVTHYSSSCANQGLR
ncbi:hypothetical protein AB2F45_25320 (plasmid) [Escherichia coli]